MLEMTVAMLHVLRSWN